MRLHEPLSGIVSLFLQPQAALSNGRRPQGGWLFLEPFSLGNAVVEHKAQRHFEGLLLPCHFIATVYSAAHEVLKRTIVPHVDGAMYIAV
jgi:hypothetical protein